jgi:hypothetical protein
MSVSNSALAPPTPRRSTPSAADLRRLDADDAADGDVREDEGDDISSVAW